VRRSSLAFVLVVVAAGCGDTAKTVTTRPPLPSFERARTHTLALGTAGLRQTTTIVVGANRVRAYDTGRVAFDGSRAHLYKLNPNGRFPGEVIVIGPFTYTNANVEAALAAPEVPPWTRLDTRRLSPGEAANQTDELSHVLAPAYLAFGATRVALQRRVADGAIFRARIDPRLVLRRLPAPRRATIDKGLRSDYPDRPFEARFWIDSKARIRRVIVAWTTPTGTPVTIDTSFGAFGRPVDTRLPRVDRIKDITPRH
jgi:hypothetical protein